VKQDTAGKKIHSAIWAALPALLLLLGIVLRVQRYLLDRSFRQDEAALALAIQGRTVASLLRQPLPGGLTAPIGFLIIEKLILGATAYTDSMFRLLPLVAGCVSLVLVLMLARRLLGNLGTIVVIGALSLNSMAIFYASDLKQYSSDVMWVALIFLALAFHLNARSHLSAAVLGIAGLVAIACSHPAIFVLASAGLVLMLRLRRDRQGLLVTLGILIVWAAGFMALYFSYYRVVGQTESVVDYWNNLDGIMPRPPWKDPSWFLIRASSYVGSVLGLTLPMYLVLGVCVTGALSFFGRNKWEWGLLVIATTGATLAASEFVHYPFKGRLILFLVPTTLLVLGEGLERLVALLRSRRWLAQGASWLLAALFLAGPAESALMGITEPRYLPYREDIKPVLSFMKDHWLPGDMVVVYDQATITYKYYAPFYGLEGAETLALKDDRNHPRRYNRVIDALPRERRIWFVFSNVLDTKAGPDVRSYLIEYMVANGAQEIQQYSFDGVSMADLVVLK
jgi:type IV secretory pathway VirB2 component (pilin)